MIYQSAYEALPPACRVGDQAILFEAIATAYDETIADWRDRLENYDQTLLDPATIDASLLDWRASLTPWRSIWNSDWSETTKRQLLANTAFVFQNRYNPALLPKLFNWFNLAATLEPKNGLILGVTLLPATLGTGLDSYRIRVPKHYGVGSAEYSLVKFLASEFGSPLAIEIVIST
jgi:Phage tail protein (Tail_P2_I)